MMFLLELLILLTSKVSYFCLFLLLICLIYISVRYLALLCKNNQEISIGQVVTIISIHENGNDCIASPLGFPYIEINCRIELPTKVGDIRVVGAYKNGIYYLY